MATRDDAARLRRLTFNVSRLPAPTTVTRDVRKGTTCCVTRKPQAPKTPSTVRASPLQTWASTAKDLQEAQPVDEGVIHAQMRRSFDAGEAASKPEEAPAPASPSTLSAADEAPTLWLSGNKFTDEDNQMLRAAAGDESRVRVQVYM